MKRYTKDEEQWLIENYPTATRKELTEKLNRNFDAIRDKAKRLGVFRDKELIVSRMAETKSMCGNHSYFKTWSKDMAYVLGMWFADGNVSSKGHYIHLALRKDDKEILDNIKEKFEFTGKLIKDKNNLKLTISSKDLHSDLINLGCIPNKSYINTTPIDIPQKYLQDFIRGYFDGDGCLTLNKYNQKGYSYSYFEVKLLGSKDFIYWLKDNIPFTHSSLTQRTENCWQISYFNNQAKLFMSWIYENKGLFLERKFIKYKALLKEVVTND